MTLDDKTIIRRARNSENPYFLLAREPMQNKAMTYAARGMLGYILSKPDDWRVMIEDLICPGSARKVVYRLLAELGEQGHMIRERWRSGKSWTYSDCIVFEMPLPLEQRPETGYLLTVEQPHFGLSVIGKAQVGKAPDSTLHIRESTKRTEKAGRREERGERNPALDARFLYYEAFQAGFPEGARPQVPDTQKNKDTAQFLYANGYQALEIAELVQGKIQSGKADYSFGFLGEDMPAERVRKLKIKHGQSSGKLGAAAGQSSAGLPATSRGIESEDEE